LADYLVTGGAGFIGSHLASALVARGDRVRVLDDLSGGSPENLAHLEIGAPGSGAAVEVVRGSVGDPAAVDLACRGVEGVFHHAALVSVPRSVEDPELSFETNVIGTFQVLEGARRAGVKRLVFASSSAVYGEDERVPKDESMSPSPASPYAGDKLAGEALLAAWSRAYGLATVALRYFNVYGPRQADDSPYSGVIAIFARRLLAREPVTIHGDGNQTRDFVFVEDVVHANLLAMERARAGTAAVYNVGTGESVSVRELARELAYLAGATAEPRFAPARAGDVRHSRASIERIHSELGFEPRVPRSDGLARTLAWYRERRCA
jgi:nucleoside-diphosphate-sugar epimerase